MTGSGVEWGFGVPVIGYSQKLTDAYDVEGTCKLVLDGVPHEPEIVWQHAFPVLDSSHDRILLTIEAIAGIWGRVGHGSSQEDEAQAQGSPG